MTYSTQAHMIFWNLCLEGNSFFEFLEGGLLRNSHVELYRILGAIVIQYLHESIVTFVVFFVVILCTFNCKVILLYLNTSIVIGGPSRFTPEASWPAHAITAVPSLTVLLNNKQ